MSHRRKSARPTNKLRRPSTVDTSSVTPDSDTDHAHTMLVEESAGAVVNPLSSPLSSSSSQSSLALPADLWHDFQALQAATHLDTASLIRRLIRQYGRSDPQGDASSNTSSEIAVTNETSDIANEDSVLDPDVTLAGEGQDNEFLVLDLSSGVKDAAGLSTPSPMAGTVEEEGVGGDTGDGPLDLSVTTKTRGSPRTHLHALAKDSDGDARPSAPVAHRGGAESLLFAALPASLQRTPASASLASTPTHISVPVSTPPLPPTAHSSTRVAAASAPAPAPSSLTSGQLTSSLFNLDPHPSRDQPEVAGGVAAVAASKAAKMVQHFLSLPANQSQAQTVTHQLTHSHLPFDRNLTGEPTVMVTSASPASHVTLPPHQSQEAASPTGTAPAMQLSALTSLDLQHAAHVQLTSQDAGLMTQAMTSLPTSGQAFLLDVGASGMVGGCGGVSLVAIPFLQALPPDALAFDPVTPAATHVPVTSAPAPPPPPPNPPSPHHLASSGPEVKGQRSKAGRPRGPGKAASKSGPKDMKLLTENRLFPGVYTSILKLPWSKRSRGKSSAAIKDVSKAASQSHKQLPTQPPPSGEATPHHLTHYLPTAHSDISANNNNDEESHKAAESTAAGLFSLPLAPSDQVSVSTPLTSSSSSSVMMVYPHGLISEAGKGSRRRGRPPKLPVLSQLLAERRGGGTDAGADELSPSQVTEAAGCALSLPGLDSSAPLDHSCGFKEHQKQPSEPMEMDRAAGRLLLERGGQGHREGHALRVLKSEAMEIDDDPRNDGRPMVALGNEQGQAKVSPEVKHHAKVRYQEELRGGKSGVLDPGEVRGHGGEFTSQTEAKVKGHNRGGGGEQFHDADVEARFNALANRLGLELGSPYHASLVLSQTMSQTGVSQSQAASLLQRHGPGLVEVKPRRRQLSNLIKPSDDCLYTSFRIRPRNSGRRGGKRGGRKRGGGASNKRDAGYQGSCMQPAGGMGAAEGSGGGSATKASSRSGHGEMVISGLGIGEDGFGLDHGDVAAGIGAGLGLRGEGCAVITERIEGAGELVSGALYEGDVIRCRLCHDVVPGDGSLFSPCACRAPPSPPTLRWCQACSALFVAEKGQGHAGGQGHGEELCQDCRRARRQALPLSGNRSPTHDEDIGTAVPNSRSTHSPQDPSSLPPPPPPPGAQQQPLLLTDPFLHPHHHHDNDNNAPISPSNSLASASSDSGFACAPCGVHFPHIADYVQHRRSAHLHKLASGSGSASGSRSDSGSRSGPGRRTHSLKTLPCPAKACPRLFHKPADLAAHLQQHHPSIHQQLQQAQQRQQHSPSDNQQGPAQPQAVPPPPQQGASPSPHSMDVDVESVDALAPSPSLSDSQLTEIANIQKGSGAAEDYSCTEKDGGALHEEYACSQAGCEEKFASPFDLLDHVQKRHEGLKRWPCPLAGCGRQFGSERHLRVHLLMHGAEKPLRCPLCPYRCRQRNALAWHVRKHPEAAGQYRELANSVSTE